MNTITIVQGVIFTLYVGFLMILFKGPLSSISESAYRLHDLWNSLFTWFCWSIGFLMFFQTEGNTPLFFISETGIIFTGAARYFKASDRITGVLHYAGAAVGKQMKYAGLLGNYFEGFKTENVSSNFSKSVYFSNISNGFVIFVSFSKLIY